LQIFPAGIYGEGMRNRRGASVFKLAEELHQVIRQFVRRLRAEGAQHKLGWSQLGAMARLETGGPTTIAALARLEGVKPQSMGATVGALEKAGFVQRRPDRSDRRRAVIWLTRAGQKIRTDGARAKRKWLAGAIEGGLDSAERKKLREAVSLLRSLLAG